MKCEICGVEYKQITSTHVTNKHGITIDGYKLRYPEAKIMSDETINRLTKKCKEQHTTPNGGFGFSEGHKLNEGREPSFKGETKETSEVVKRFSEKLKGRVVTDSTRLKQSEIAKQQYMSGERKKMFGKDNPMYGRKLSKEHVEKLHKSTRNGLKKTKPEIELEKLITSYGFIFTGDRTKWVIFNDGKRKNPDFTHNKLNFVIEVYGDYWHRNDDPTEMVEKYRGIGIECLVLWEHEILKYGGIRSIVEEFINE